MGKLREVREVREKLRDLKIILKIFVKISSISDAIHNKTLPKSEVFERIFS